VVAGSAFRQEDKDELRRYTTEHGDFITPEH